MNSTLLQNQLRRLWPYVYSYGVAAVLLCLALFMRFYMLAEKPPHHDESINGWFVLQMWKTGFFRYDPSNYHGPLLFYFLQLAEILFGDSIWTLRAVVSFFSFLTIAAFCWRAVYQNKYWFIGALVLMFSPGAAFFGRSAIHESVLVFSFLVLLWSLEDLQNRMVTFAFALACAFSLKETTALLVVSGVVGAAIARFNPLVHFRNQKANIGRAVLVFLIVIVALFSGFFQNFHGIADFFIAYLPWLKTGVGGGGHDKPFYFWGKMLLEYEQGTVLLALAGSALYPVLQARQRFFILIAWIHFLLFSLIPYKTPWCMLSIQLPFIYAGVTAIASLQVVALKFDFIQKWKRPVVVLSAVLLFACCLSGSVQMMPIVYQHPLELKHPFVYVQTEYEFKEVIAFLDVNEELLRKRSIYVLNSESWPLPWWLRRHNLVYGSNGARFNKQHDIIFVDGVERIEADKVYESEYWSKEFKTRDSRGSAVIYIRKELYQRMVLVSKDPS